VVVAEFLDAHKFPIIVHDPVMKSSSGTELLDAGGIKYLMTELLKRASVFTPNVPEAEALTGMEIKDLASMEAAARKLAESEAALADMVETCSSFVAFRETSNGARPNRHATRVLGAFATRTGTGPTGALRATRRT